MRTKFSGILTLFMAFVVQLTFAQEKTITGTVTDTETGMPLAGVNIVIEGTTTGTQTDFDGNYSIEASAGQTLVFTYIGYADQSVVVGSDTSINISMQAGATLDQVVITALGISREKKSLPYAAQTVEAEELNITGGSNVKTALAGKVAGVQINGQAGSKLGQSGGIRIRGRISMTSDADPLYVVNGIPTDSPNAINMANVKSVNVLKGPAATALYGQRADNGVVMIVTKSAEEGDRMTIEINSNVTFDKVINRFKYQNLYGKGYNGEASFGIFDYSAGSPFGVPYPAYMQAFDGKRYFAGQGVYADESWGPRFDGEGFIPWYAQYQNSPYFAQEQPYVAQPDNIEEFYDTGSTFKNTVSVSGAGENFTGRISFTNLEQKGIIPNSGLHKNYISSGFDMNLTDDFKLGMTVNYAEERIAGNFDDGYSNGISGSFNSWFNRNLNISKLKELQGLTTTEGFLASWNNWGLDRWAFAEATGVLGFKKAAFWFNPYDLTYYQRYTDRRTDLLADIHGSYTFLENFKASFQVSRNSEDFHGNFRIPYLMEFSAAPNLYLPLVNSFGNTLINQTEDNYKAFVEYTNEFDKFEVKALFGGNLRKNDFYRLRANMDTENFESGGLILPDVYTYANSAEKIVPATFQFQKQVNSLYGNVSLSYDDLIYLDASYRRDWSSALPADQNGYGYPSVGTSIIFSELLENDSFLTFGKFRAGWAQVGDDVDALDLTSLYFLGSDVYNGQVLQYTPTRLVDPNIKPALNSSYEFGVDLRFLENRLGLSATYYSETREDEIIPITISSGSGYSRYLTNGGESERKGIELTLDADIVKTDDFTWNLMANFAKNESEIISLPAGLQSIEALPNGLASDDWNIVTVVHEVGKEWGQLTGTGYVYDENGNRVIRPDGTYAYETNKEFGSVLPDFTGGFINTFSYKNLSLVASFDYQSGGQFYSLSENWSDNSGLSQRTAHINDKGNNVRLPVADGGGVHVTGVYEDGSPADTYVEVQSYYKQFFNGRIAEEYIHDASYFKLRNVSLTYRLPGSMVNDVFESASISLIARNVWLISVSDDNTHEWDPSEMSKIYGENAQLPGTRSFGLNLNLTF